MAKTELYSALTALLKVIFPPKCYHCKRHHEKLGVPLCNVCFSYLEARPSEGEIVITFEDSSPAQSLISTLKNGSSSELATILAAYMAIQYAKSKLPLPDFVTAVPTSTWRKWQMGQESATSLAKELATLLDCPYQPLLYRRRQMLRQDQLSREERKYLSSDEFEWNEKHNLRGKTVLLVDDTITTGTTLACCAEKIWEASPAKIVKMVCVDRGYLQE